MGTPLAYLITFTCYGTWLHGDSRGFTHHSRNQVGEDRPEPSEAWRIHESRALEAQPYVLSSRARLVVLAAIRAALSRGHGQLHAAHVRPTHAHVVVSLECPPERALNRIKAFASRALSREMSEPAGTRRWTRHGSTEYLWTADDLAAAMEYVVDRQGAPVALYRADDV